MPARMSDKFAIGDPVTFMLGSPPVRLFGVVGHMSFDRSGRNQVLVRYKKHKASYRDEDDVEPR